MREIIFKGNGETFSELYEAEKWLRENGYSYGSSCIGYPIGVLRGRERYIPKMRNMTPFQRRTLDGYLYHERDGEAKLVLKHDNPELVKS